MIKLKDLLMETGVMSPAINKQSKATSTIYINNSLLDDGGGGWGWGGGGGGGDDDDKFWIIIRGKREDLDIDGDPDDNPVIQLARDHGGRWKTYDPDKKDERYNVIGVCWFGIYARNNAMEFLEEAFKKFPNKYQYFYENGDNDDENDANFQIFPFDQRIFNRLLVLAEKYSIDVHLTKFDGNLPVFFIYLKSSVDAYNRDPADDANWPEPTYAKGLTELYEKMYKLYISAREIGLYGSSANWPKHEKDWKK